MVYEVEAPKYMRLAQTIQRQIEEGVYQPGSLVPSENQLANSSGMSRPTVVRALDLLKRDGWLESRQGYGTVVRARPEVVEKRERRGQIALEREESQGLGYVVGVGFVQPPQRIADLLGVSRKTLVLARRFLVDEAGEPAELVCSYFSKEAIEGTQLAGPDPLGESTRSHVEARKKIHYDNMAEYVSARPASDEESELLGLDGREWLLTVLAAAHDVAGRVLQVMEVLLPADGREIREIYRLG